MRFVETPLRGAFVMELEKIHDDRGYFARSWSDDELRDRGLVDRLAQCSISFNKKRGTLRGMHFQVAPHTETKIVRCTRGALFDVIIDLRPDSTTFKKWFGVELTADGDSMLYIPANFAHGFQTLADDTEIFYQISDYYAPQAARGVRWSDPAFGITWPLSVSVIHQRDNEYKDFDPSVLS